MHLASHPATAKQNSRALFTGQYLPLQTCVIEVEPISKEMGISGRSSNLPRAPRSSSLPQALNRAPDQASGHDDDDKYSAVPSSSNASPVSSLLRTGRLIKSGLRVLSESQSFTASYNRRREVINDLCADLDITDSDTDDTRDLKTVSRHLKTTHLVEEECDLQDRVSSSCHRALATPDILYEIFEQLDALNTIPHEFSQKRRKPMSLRHAQLIYGDTQKAVDVWERSQSKSPATCDYAPAMGLFNCLLVNSLWYDCTKRVLEKRLHFHDPQRWRQFVQTVSKSEYDQSRKPNMLILHKLTDSKQLEIERLGPVVGGNLEWLEFYTCPGIAPTASLLQGGRLTKIVLPGCSRVTDRTLYHISEHCPDLEYLDLRACEQVSDKGLKIIAKYCPNLTLVNVGRTKGGELVTYKGVKHLARQTKVNTLGLAGCNVDDRAIWELALSRGPELQRLSLNKCTLLTDASIPRILGYTPNLSVLEIRGCLQITDMRPLALFKRYKEHQGHPPLIEGCETIERRMQIAVNRLRQEISRQILADCQEWVNMAK